MCPLLPSALTEMRGGSGIDGGLAGKLQRERRGAGGRTNARRGKGKACSVETGKSAADSGRKRSMAVTGGMDLREILILADGFPVGFADPGVNGMLKNRRNPGWRI